MIYIIMVVFSIIALWGTIDSFRDDDDTSYIVYCLFVDVVLVICWITILAGWVK